MSTQTLASLEKSIGYSFKNILLLKEALTHPSCNNKKSTFEGKNNQRLEFLGDSVLGLILAEAVFLEFLQEREGKLTQVKGILEHGQFLSKIAKKLDLDRYIAVGDSEKCLGTSQNASTLEDALEAIIGAIYLDGGWSCVKEVVLQWYGDWQDYVKNYVSKHNPKGQLQEYFQAKTEKEVPAYSIVESQGPDHAKRYVAVVKMKGQVLGEGTGSSKKEAEENAAARALEGL